jgi:hypothetical protein
VSRQLPSAGQEVYTCTWRFGHQISVLFCENRVPRGSLQGELHIARIRVSKEPNRGLVRGSDEPCLIQRKAILSLGSLSQCYPLSPYRLFALSAVSHDNSPSLGISLACLKPKKKKLPGGPGDGVTKGDHCHSQHSENDTPPPHFVPSFCIRMRCFRQRARIFALQGPLMFSLTSLTHTLYYAHSVSE